MLHKMCILKGVKTQVLRGALEKQNSRLFTCYALGSFAAGLGSRSCSEILSRYRISMPRDYLFLQVCKGMEVISVSL